MDVAATFLPVAVSLIDDTFGTPIVYEQLTAEVYDPATGTVQRTVVTHNIKAGVLSMGRTEEGGASETRQLRLWLHHGDGGLPGLPVTGDEVQYLGTTWKVQNIDPTYAGDRLIASKVTCQAPG